MRDHARKGHSKQRETPFYGGFPLATLRLE